MMKNAVSLVEQICNKSCDIESWFSLAFNRQRAPFYSSVDLRYDGHKMVSVDTNLFPGGFNNLRVQSHPLAISALRYQHDLLCPWAKRILLMVENHTRNQAYLANVAVLNYLFTSAGMQLRVIRVGAPAEEYLVADYLQQEALNVNIEEPTEAELRGDFSEFNPCAIILNHDLSAGLIPMLRNIELPVYPPAYLGWYLRKKSDHFALYREIVTNMCEQVLELDPWLLVALDDKIENLNIDQGTGIELAAQRVDELLHKIKQKREQLEITDSYEPYVAVKADNGTYGMGVMIVHSGQELLELNRKQRNKMNVIKDKVKVSSWYLQEGVASIEKVEEDTAETVVYMIGHDVVGSFYRCNRDKDSQGNLNSKGMYFNSSCNQSFIPSIDFSQADEASKRSYAYGVVARLANLAAARETIEHI